MSLNGQLSKQPLGSQFDQNPRNKLSYTSSKTYPLRPLKNPTLTHAQTKGYKIVWQGEHFIDTNHNHHKFEDNDFKWIAIWWFQEIIMTFFLEHTMVYLHDAFVSKQGIGLEKYK